MYINTIAKAKSKKSQVFDEHVRQVFKNIGNNTATTTTTSTTSITIGRALVASIDAKTATTTFTICYSNSGPIRSNLRKKNASLADKFTTNSKLSYLNINKSNALINACLNNDQALVIDLITNKKTDVNTMNEYGFTGLLWCCMLGYYDLARLMVNLYRADTNIVHKYSLLPSLFYSIRYGHANIVRLLLVGGADVLLPLPAVDSQSTQVNKVTVSETAATAGNGDDADADDDDDDGTKYDLKSPLIIALKMKKIDIVLQMIRYSIKLIDIDALFYCLKFFGQETGSSFTSIEFMEHHLTIFDAYNKEVVWRRRRNFVLFLLHKHYNHHHHQYSNINTLLYDSNSTVDIVFHMRHVQEIITSYL